jgi:hypothetical protein
MIVYLIARHDDAGIYPCAHGVDLSRVIDDAAHFGFITPSEMDRFRTIASRTDLRPGNCGYPTGTYKHRSPSLILMEV